MAGFADEVYKRSPVFLQNLMVTAYGFQWKRLRFGGTYREELEGYLNREHFSRDEWQQDTERRLRSLLTTASERVPYYRERWQDLGLPREQLQDFQLSDLPTLAPLEKDVARDAPHSLLVGGRPARRHLVFGTSGSSGTPISTYWLPEEYQRSTALREARAYKFAGISFAMPRATFGGRAVEPSTDSQGPFHRYNWFEKQVYLSAFHVKPDAAQAYVDALWRHGIQWITGYANSIYQLSDLILDLGLDAPQLKAVVTTSEKVTPDERTSIEQAFSTRVYEEYGAVEDLFYVCECEHGRKHINPDAGIIEIVDEDFRPVPDGEEGEVLATGFVRPHQPMIRFRIGDRAFIDPRPCPCGREMPVLGEVIGRLEDTVYGPDGRRMVRFHGIFIDQPHVREGQIIQERLDHIRVRVVPKPGFGSDDRQSIVARVQQRLTCGVEVSVEPVDHIERTPAGKFRAVISNLSPDEIEKARTSVAMKAHVLNQDG